MSLVFGPKKLGIGISDPSQVTVVELVNGLPSSAPVDFTAPVTVTSSGISFEVAEAGRYRVTAKNPYASESVTVDLSPDLPYASDIQSKVDYLISTGGTEDGTVTSVNGKTGVVVLTASDVSARPASWVPSWTDVSGKPATFTPSAHTHDDKLDVGTGTQSASTYRRGDGTWATPPDTTYTAISQPNIENPAGTTSGLITGQRFAQGLAANNVVTGDGISNIVTITQTAYDALPTKDASTFYVIVED